MKLTYLNPKWVGAGGPGISDASGQPIPKRSGVGLMFDCPCGECDHRVYVGLENPLDGKGPHVDPHEPKWRRTGDSFEALTLHPSVLRTSDCGWHGWIRDGEVIPC